LQERWTGRLRRDQPICDIDEVFDTFNYCAAFPDYKSWLGGCYYKFPNISSVHFFHITQNGITSMCSNSKDVNWRVDNSVEPFLMIKKNPANSIPGLVDIPTIDQERLATIRNKAKFSERSKVLLLLLLFFFFHSSYKKPFWDDIFSGGVGTTSSVYLKPDLEQIIGFQHIKKVLPSSDEDMIVEENTKSPKESAVKSFGKLITYSLFYLSYSSGVA
jgi:hypothetical protein